MSRGYQYGFSVSRPYVYDVAGRERKARTMVAVLEDYLHRPLANCDLLNVGGSTGIIDNYLSEHFKSVVGVDIDEPAIRHARKTYRKHNLVFEVADALNLPFKDASFDVVICSHVYEHVPDPHLMFNEIHRVLKAGGVCYFSAGNRLAWNEPHYNLPLLSVLPRPLAHQYIRMSGKARYYHEKHLSYWGLNSLVKSFHRTDYTKRLVTEPQKFHSSYLIRPGSFKAMLAETILKLAYWASPGYIWILEKQAHLRSGQFSTTCREGGT
jgi:ubiquinone/menaquinone biosynthesis C-methylase UbiE